MALNTTPVLPASCRLACDGRARPERRGPLPGGAHPRNPSQRYLKFCGWEKGQRFFNTLGAQQCNRNDPQQIAQILTDGRQDAGSVQIGEICGQSRRGGQCIGQVGHVAWVIRGRATRHWH